MKELQFHNESGKIRQKELRKCSVCGKLFRTASKHDKCIACYLKICMNRNRTENGH